jgi:hypothetical protein
LFAPYNWSGLDTGPGKKIVCFVVRLSNGSRAPAFLYLETMSVELRYAGNWVKTEWCEPPASVQHLRTDFPEELRTLLGVDVLKPLRRFQDLHVTYAAPVSGLLILRPDGDEACRGFDAIRVTVKDCHLKPHVLTADVTEQAP